MTRYAIYAYAIISVVIQKTVAQVENTTMNGIVSNARLNSFQLAKKYGYPIERHRLITEDGYIIELQRLPYGKQRTDQSNRPPVLLEHGLGGSGANFLISGKTSMAFVLCEAGYDVWIGNARGTQWSKKQINYNNHSKKYWQFDWHEIGVYDYVAAIYYIANVTHQEKIYFIGHSQGGTSYMAMVTERPQINDKIRLAMLLGPTIYTNHNRNSILLMLSENINRFKGILEYLHLNELPIGVGFRRLMQIICLSDLSFLCERIGGLIMGNGSSFTDKRVINGLFSMYPAGMSFQQLEHYAQIITARRFQKYDYGREGNLEQYGSVIPPLYNISKVTAPVALIREKNDIFFDEGDANDLCKDLPNCVINYEFEDEIWNHFAYVVGNKAHIEINEELIKMMKQYY